MSVSNGIAMMSQPRTVQNDHGIPFVSGGVSMDDRQTLRQMTKDDNLQLIFAAKNRDYLSDVMVRITDNKGHEVLNTVAQGPWLFTKLPTGKYRLHATTKGQSQGTTFEVPTSGQARVYLSWNDTILKTPSHITAKR